MPGIRQLRENYHAVGIIDSDSDKKQVPHICERCHDNYGVVSNLGPRIYQDEEGNVIEPRADADSWLQSHNCGKIYANFELKEEAQLVTLTQPTDNPFNKGGDILGLAETRIFDKTGKRQRKRKFKQDLSYIKDEDVRREVAEGAKLISYQQRGDN